MNDMDRMLELGRQGFFCSQILIIQGMELQGKDNPDLVRAMQGLAGGLGFTGETCGALTGGACLLGLYAGKGAPDEEENLNLMLMIGELVSWFKETYGPQYGGIRCETILDNDPSGRMSMCPALVAATLQKVKELLVEHGIDLSGLDE